MPDQEGEKLCCALHQLHARSFRIGCMERSEDFADHTKKKNVKRSKVYEKYKRYIYGNEVIFAALEYPVLIGFRQRNDKLCAGYLVLFPKGLCWYVIR